MSNDDRIKAWREQRRAGVLPTDPQATALRQAFSRTAALVGDADATVHSILRVALDSLAAFAEKDLGERRALYERMSAGVQAGIEERRLSPSAAEYWTRRIALVTRAIENDIRRNVDVFAGSYAQDALIEADQQLLARRRSQLRRERADKLREERRRATREDIAHTIPMPPEDASDLAALRPLLNRLHATQRPVGAYVPRILTVLPLFYLRLQIIQSDSKIALIWVFFGPVVLMTIISSLYFLSGQHFIMGMDVLSFTLSGSVTWIMFRMIVFRSSESYFGGRVFINLEPVTPLMMALVNSAFYLVVYLFVMTVLIVAGHLIHVITIPDNIPGVIACVAGVGAVAASFGLVFAGIASRWEYFIRFAPMIERALQLFSGVFFVSEQLPEMYRKYVLWWPLSHGFQLLRSAYFVAYKSHDASLTYFLVSIIMFLAAGLVADRLARSNIQPM
jgi:capsular polysaccharide transport system permease protein